MWAYICTRFEGEIWEVRESDRQRSEFILIYFLKTLAGLKKVVYLHPQNGWVTIKHESRSSGKEIRLSSLRYWNWQRMGPRRKVWARIETKLRIVPENFLRDGFSYVLLNYLRLHDEEFDPGSGWTLAAGLTHASRTVSWELALNTSGERVRNAYATYLLQGNSPGKLGLMPHSPYWEHLRYGKDLSAIDGHASH